MKKSSILIGSAMIASLVACSGGLPTLKSSIPLPDTGLGISAPSVPGVAAPKPTLGYSETVNYWGFIKPGQQSDGIVDGKKKAYYLYVWVPAAVAEIGVRMISPTGEIGEPGAHDIVSDSFKAATPEEKNMPNWFDTWIRVERMAAIMPDQIDAASKKPAVQKLKDDDDGDDTYHEERHAKYNSLTRITIPSIPKSLDELKNIDTKKLLVRGLYRIAFTTYKPGEVKGSFVATVGVLGVPGTPGLSPIVHSNPEELQKQAIAAEEALKKALSGSK
ncbi:outer membrane surface lipoprotein LipL32 [Leptospira fluminis]|uniref:Outer membrane surface lipoprotein LipL32 n=1 Tax=Leptospira fluminis TaxID=2484979 RepID=A0A4R9GMA1_9LEPT|nr:major surface lipoprotein LipL32 [Leptospira fluminis]TGK17342.1 outer membrane surface lipoprotein LipL32 [Leptospira fluminis]